MKFLALIIFIFSIIFLGFAPEQDDFSLIVSGFSAAFVSYFLLIKKTDFSTSFLIGIAIALRFLLVFSFPNLSDDIYRFLWDGKLLHLGESPFKYVPSEWIKIIIDGEFDTLYPLLNSPDYYSVYPPFAQLVFYISTFSWMNSAIVIKLLLFISECISIFMGIKLLKHLNLPIRNILWYALNPLVIIEVMVNIHFEGFMVCFFLLFLYYLHVHKYTPSALFFALSVATKLVPLLFLPYFLGQWKFRRFAIFYLKIAAFIILLFLPMLFQIGGFGDSLDLYFRKFEFNASFYYVFREIGLLFRGFNMIATIGPLMGVFIFISVVLLAFRKMDIFNFCQWSLLIFLLFSTTIHPWYVILGVMLSIFSSRKFFIVWSFLVVLSYSKYALSDNWYYAFVAIEYIILILFVTTETIQQRKTQPLSSEV